MAGDRSTHHRTRVISRSLAVLLAGWWLAALPQTASAQLGGRAVPPPTYFLTMQNAYDRGDYASALRGFQDEWQGGIKNGAVRWVDSICFHTMLGECYYQEGDHSRALEQYNAACNLWIAHSTWMMNVQWPAAPRAANGNVNVAPWGTSNRRPQYAVYNDTYSVKQGNIDNSNVARNGGVVQLAVMFPVNVIEVCRCTALSARRRREILGPLVTFDTLAGDLVARLSGPSTPPGNWSQCFVDVMLGCSLAAAGKDQAAKTALERGLVAAGTFDHPLTGTALFELGRIELTAGNFLGAAGRFEEATYAAFQSNDVHLLEESFRYFALAHIMNGKPGNFGAAIAQAMTWAKARRAEPLYASLATLSAEALTVAGDARGATSAIGAAASAMGRNALASGKAGARMNFIAAQIFYQQGDVNNGDASLARAMAFQAGGSLWIFQMVLADEWFKKGVISPREAFDVYRTVLREPTPADWLSSPMESITTLLTPHPGPLENWFHVALGRKENEAAIDISDLIRRHRFFNSQAIGGRLLSLRWVLDGPEASLPQAVKLQRQDILAAFPAYDAAKKEAEALRAKIEAQPLLTADGEVQQQQAKLLEQYTIATARQEAVLKEISLRRTPCEMVFPPRRKIEDVQKSLGPKTACLAYIMAANRLYSCIITQKDLNITEITRATGGRGSVFTNVETLLKDWGNINAQRQIPAQTLAQERWKAIADDLSQQLLRTARTDFPAGYDELVVVPEGPLWYLPFEVLGSGGAESAPLITKLRVRYAPTVGLIVPDGRQRRPLPSTLLAVGKIYAQDKTGITDAA
ncbi:MAG TPA: hypothetical protein VGE52_09845, partial [Pirellulales bacterium]